MAMKTVRTAGLGFIGCSTAFGIRRRRIEYCLCAVDMNQAEFHDARRIGVGDLPPVQRFVAAENKRTV
ncbi:MAG: hypothetical protein ABF868_01100 [Sporolactobacillus sp.]